MRKVKILSPIWRSEAFPRHCNYRLPYCYNTNNGNQILIGKFVEVVNESDGWLLCRTDNNMYCVTSIVHGHAEEQFNPKGFKVGNWVQGSAFGGPYEINKIEGDRFWIYYHPGMFEDGHQYSFSRFTDLKVVSRPIVEKKKSIRMDEIREKALYGKVEVYDDRMEKFKIDWNQVMKAASPIVGYQHGLDYIDRYIGQPNTERIRRDIEEDFKQLQDFQLKTISSMFGVSPLFAGGMDWVHSKGIGEGEEKLLEGQLPCSVNRITSVHTELQQPKDITLF